MKTAVVILNWNGLSFLKQFLPTLIQYTKEAKIVVIDNQSTDDSLLYIDNHHPQVEVIKNSENGGFAKGYNDGLINLKGRFEYYALINSDIEVTQDWLNPLIDQLDKDRSIAGVQPKVRAYHRKDHFEHAGASGGFIDKNYYPFCRGRIFDELEKDVGQYENTKEIFWTTGACMVVRSEVYHQLGGLDEDFFAHMEEIDFCWRAKKQNYAFYVVPSSTVYHVGGGTLNYQHPKKTYLNFRNSLYMIHKNHEGWLFGKVLYRLLLDGVAAFKYLISLQWKHIFAIIKAHQSYFKEIGNLKKKRQKIQAESTVFNTQGFYKASILWAYFFKRIRVFSQLNKRFFSN
ncbi:hypothetical protein CW751_14055 [Brumimicrobium salinarum]|uniref:Glycosyltransferase 2-like domain-containing protein n=1 Tax=Brumimicrobium salinarum TaxID=2058658 RepID=A0A2I0QZ61_9FLAO|nr:glycosyltransferase family 2 protein [Brumimicrobium salinarum]PKR79616.1 hypothetical protein CW751_14055 [Brumimicrobium salinarum]